MLCGLLGQSLKHSYSPQIHNQLGEYEYRLFEKDPDQLQDFLENSEFTGINVTIPYKKSVLPFCRQLTPEAKKLGAVNTIVRLEDGSLLGHNTDYFGFRSMVDRSGVSVSGKKVLVLGSGGASNTVCAVMNELNANVIVISRSGENSYKNLHLHSDAAIIVNTTPVGTYPDTHLSPIDLDIFPALEAVFDLIYNPARTRLLLDAEKRNLKTENGLYMLVAQAKESSALFQGKLLNDSVILPIYQSLKQQIENIVLIGMPGCGKSTIGKLLAEKTGKRFVDVDAEITAQVKCPISDIFLNHGEAYFRQLETDVLSKLGKLSGLVIATGGGCVTQMRNYDHLHQNGSIIWLQRNIDILPTEGRPLSIGADLHVMYCTRKPLYSSFADYTVSNDGTADNTAKNILKVLDWK